MIGKTNIPLIMGLYVFSLSAIGDASAEALCGGAWCDGTQPPGVRLASQPRQIAIDSGALPGYETPPCVWTIWKFTDWITESGQRVADIVEVVGHVPRNEYERGMFYPGTPQFEQWKRSPALSRPPTPKPPLPEAPPVVSKLFVALAEFRATGEELLYACAKAGGNAALFLDQLTDTLRTTGLYGSIGRVGGLINQVGISLLDPQIYDAVKLCVQAYYDPNPDTQRNCMDPVNRRQMQQTLSIIDEQRGQILQPKSTSGNRNSFDAPVKKNKPVFVDPPLARGFEYQTNPDGPLFASIALPYIVRGQGKFQLETLQQGKWKKIADLSALKEYRFPKAVSRFRVLNIPIRAGVSVTDPSQQWVVMLSFNRDGKFRGTTTGLAN